ncbi:MAG: hypothetical protein K0R80_3224 [Clostridia bacterium]|nr:hypothetical protein [Clostridia bacterium]
MVSYKGLRNLLIERNSKLVKTRKYMHGSAGDARIMRCLWVDSKLVIP